MNKGKVKTRISQEEERALAFASRFSRLSNSLRSEEGLRVASQKGQTHWINPKSKHGIKESNFYSFDQIDYSELQTFLNQIYEKEERLRALGYDMHGVKSFNRNVWLDLSRESNAIEGILDDFSYSLLDFRNKLRGSIITNGVADEGKDPWDLFRSAREQLLAFKQKNDCLIIEGNKKKHQLSFATISHFAAFKYAYNCSKYFRNREITAEDFFSILLNVTALLSDSEIVKMRQEPIYVFGAPWTPVGFEQVHERMKGLSKWVTDEKQSGRLHPIEVAALFHAEFVRIHPFMDGNGRTGRIMSNFILMLCDMPTMSIKAGATEQYFDEVNHAVMTHEADGLIKMFYNAVYDSAKKIDECLDFIEKTEKPTKQTSAKTKE